MAPRAYTATLSQNRGRTGYSVIFRHPVLKDRASGKPGLRIRRGLATKDSTEAEHLCSQLNQILAEPQYHQPAARAVATQRFDSRVVEMFYEGMAAEAVDPVALRDNAIAFPDDPEYRKVLLLGTTGAGKTTLVRQLIGSDPESERFPSTSTAKTTVHDTEIILQPGSWQAVVTFVTYEEAREYLQENVSAAAVAAFRNADDAAVLKRLLSHVNQRFRFNYILGNGPTEPGADFDDDDSGLGGDSLLDADEVDSVDMQATNELLTSVVTRLRALVARLASQTRDELKVSDAQDERVLEELLEEELDRLLREEEDYHQIADDLMDEIEQRFALLPPGDVERTRGGWPTVWTSSWPAQNRGEFFKAIATFTSNYAPRFGRLLTPLVNGVRVAGPFAPSFTAEAGPKLVLLDGEGLGHTPRSSSAVSTSVSRRIELADAVVLVDSAAQPMQAAPIAAMRELVATGNARKLIYAFTHFDEVKGDNLPGLNAKADHVLASAENVLSAIGEDLGPAAERALRARLDSSRCFLADLQTKLDSSTTSAQPTKKQLQRLLDAVAKTGERPEPVPEKPVYDRMNLALAIKSAAEAFHEDWQPRLGLAFSTSTTREHWTRIKALSRRLAMGWADEYDTLRPVADLGRELKERVYLFAQHPVRWTPKAPAEAQQQVVLDAFAEAVGRRILVLAGARLWRERQAAWQSAFDQSGRGSTFVRARIIDDEVYDAGVPIPDVTPSPDGNKFLKEVVAEVQAAADEVGVILE